MTPTIYQYIPSLNVLRQKATMEEPSTPGSVDHDVYLHILASLPTIPVSGTGWEEGKEYVIGKNIGVIPFMCCISPMTDSTDCLVDCPMADCNPRAYLLPAESKEGTCSTRCDWPKCTLPGCVERGFPDKSIFEHDGRLFTRAEVIQIAMEAWEAGYDADGRFNKYKYFKDKFNHDI